MFEVEAFLFDLDGTLVDTRKPNYLAYREALKVAGIDFSESAFRHTWGQDSRDFIVALAPGISRKEVDEIRAHKSRIYASYLDAADLNVDLVDFARSVIGQTQIALVTTAKEDNARAVLTEFHLTDLFNVTVFGEDVSRGKPDPEAYLLALERLGVRPESAIAFEDSISGFSAARAADLRVLRVDVFS